MPIATGDRIPSVDIRLMINGVPSVESAADLLGSGQVVLFAVPGAFTPGCSTRHLPGYIERAAEISARGVDRIACISVNDVFVMDAWGRAHGVAETFTMLADPDASFTKAIGMEIDASGFGLGLRSKRYAMVITDGVVTTLLEEENGLSIMNSTAECVLERI
jgi:peroxiredoxin